MTYSFNLIDKHWLPCIWKETGKHEELPLRQLLLDAHYLTELYGDTPLTTAALHRLLLAIVYAIPWKKSWAEMWHKGQGCFSEEAVNSYFEKWQEHFDLFGEKYRFYQITAEELTQIKLQLSAKSDKHEPESISRLTEERASGQNPTLFDHTIDNVTLSPAEAARRLVTAQAYSLSSSGTSIKGLPNYAGPCFRGVLFFIEGDNLFQTLMLNLIKRDEDRPIPVLDAAKDRPIWEVEQAPSPKNMQPWGYLDYLTWQTRRIRLLPETLNDQQVVREVYVFPGRGLNKSVEDPMMAFRDTKIDRNPIGLSLHRALWRNSTALLTTTAEGHKRQAPASLDWVAGQVINGVVEPSYLFHYMAISLKTKQGGLIEMQRHERIPLPLKILAKEQLHKDIEGAIQTAEGVGSALGSVEVSLAVNLGLVQKTDKEKTLKARQQLKLSVRYWSRLEMPFYQFMRDLPDDAQNALDAWRQILLMTARTAFAESTSKLMGATNTLSPIAEAENLLERKLWFIKKEW